MIERISGSHPRVHLREFADEVLIYILLHENAFAGRRYLPRIKEDAIYSLACSELQIRIWKNDTRRLASELE